MKGLTVTCRKYKLVVDAFCDADYDSSRLFWVDAKLHVIFTSDFNGQNRQVVLTSYNNLVHPFSVAVFEVCSSFSVPRLPSADVFVSGLLLF